MGGKALGGLGGAGGSGAGSVTSNLPPRGHRRRGAAASPANPANFGLKDFGAAGMPASAMTGTQGAMNALTSNLGRTAGIALPGLATLGAPQAGRLALLHLMMTEISRSGIAKQSQNTGTGIQART